MDPKSMRLKAQAPRREPRSAANSFLFSLRSFVIRRPFRNWILDSGLEVVAVYWARISDVKLGFAGRDRDCCERDGEENAVRKEL